MDRVLFIEDDQDDPIANYEPQDHVIESSDSETDYGSSLATRVWKLTDSNEEFKSIEEEEEDEDTPMEFEGFEGFDGFKDSDFETIRRKMRKPTQLFGLNTIIEEMIESTLDELEQDLKMDFSSDPKVIIFKSQDPLHDYDNDHLTSGPPSSDPDHRRSHTPHIEKTAKEKRKHLRQLLRNNSDTLQRLYNDKADRSNNSSHPAVNGHSTVLNFAIEPNTDFDVEVKFDSEKVHVFIHDTNKHHHHQQHLQCSLIKRLFKFLVNR